jgi:alpha-glucosidase
MRAALFLSCFTILIATTAPAARLVAAEPREITIRSPDHKNELSLATGGTDGEVTFSVARSDKRVLQPSSIDVTLAGKGSLAASSTIAKIDGHSKDETVRLAWGKASAIPDRYSAATLRLKGASGIEWDIELRAYDDGVALRYGLPEQNALRDFVIEDEAIQFRFQGDPSVLFMTCTNFTTSHEAPYERKPLSELPHKKLFELPLTAVWSDGPAAAILEGRLRDFAGMYLERTEDKNQSVLRNRLAPLPGKSNAVVTGRAPVWSAWRVILLADSAGKLIESNLPVLLNDPPKGDFSWAKPGKSTWHWWHGGDEGLAKRGGMNFATHKPYIDFCANHGILYHAVVGDGLPWHVQSGEGYMPQPDTDILTPRPGLELPKILEYAKQKGVGIRLWVHWLPLSKKLDEAFAKYESWGIKGLMVDFMDRNDQEMVDFNERVLESAARHKLHIQFHGSYPPSGEHRTFPHLFNREGVLNLEYLKWSDTCSPPHNVTVAYTRLLAGPLDYHLGGFRSASRRDFKPQNVHPAVLGTRCHQLAMYVVYENAMPMVCDTLSSYEGQVGFDFIAEVPTTWDETRFVAGEAGGYVVVARRKGDVWYLGGMTDWTPRKLELPMRFLGKGSHEVSFYVDGSPRDEEPNAIRRERQEVNAESKVAVSLSSGGGCVAVIRPK